jgi:hypothetical protein
VLGAWYNNLLLLHCKLVVPCWLRAQACLGLLLLLLLLLLLHHMLADVSQAQAPQPTPGGFNHRTRHNQLLGEVMHVRTHTLLQADT